MPRHAGYVEHKSWCARKSQTNVPVRFTTLSAEYYRLAEMGIPVVEEDPSAPFGCSYRFDPPTIFLASTGDTTCLASGFMCVCTDARAPPSSVADWASAMPVKTSSHGRNFSLRESLAERTVAMACCWRAPSTLSCATSRRETKYIGPAGHRSGRR